MTRARRTTGIAIISVLVIMVGVLALGTGAFLLTQVNIGIVTNVRTNTLARSYAETGLDAAQVALENHYAGQVASTGTGEFPDTLTVPSVQGLGFSASFTLLAYDKRSSDEALVRIRGDGPVNAEHIVEALIAAFPGEPELPPFFDFGLSSQGVITTNGTSTYINSGIHGNLGFDLGSSDTFAVCLERDADGVCITSQDVSLEDAPVSASAGWTTCSPAELCDGGAPRALTDPITVTAQYEQTRDIAIFDADTGAVALQSTFEGLNPDTSTRAYIGCDEVVTDPTTYSWDAVASDTTVCVTSVSMVSIPRNASLTNVNILAMGDIDLGRDVTITGSTLVSLDGRVQAGNNGNNSVTVTDSEVYSEDGIILNGSQTSISGETTLASTGSVTINGGSPAVTASDGSAGVGLVLLSGGDVVVNGSSDWYIAAIAEGTFTQNGTSVVYGRAASVGDMTFNGGIDIDSGLDIVNDDITQEGPPFTQTLSRR